MTMTVSGLLKKKLLHYITHVLYSMCENGHPIQKLKSKLVTSHPESVSLVTQVRFGGGRGLETCSYRLHPCPCRGRGKGKGEGEGEGEGDMS